MTDSPSIAAVLALLAGGDWGAAAEAARRATGQQPDSRLADALARFLGGVTAPGVYDEPRAFETFIDNGGNVALYRQTSEQLAARQTDVQPRRVLDIGCGDGRVTAASLQPSTTRVDLVEPSAPLLARAVDAVARPGLEVVAHQVDASSFFAGLDDDTRWDLVQSTFALHTIRPAERPALLRSLVRRTNKLLIVEFDVPAFADRSTAHLEYLADRYERGVREYRDHPDVITGFLMPVLVGQLDPSRARYTFEQPIAAWADLLRDAGFTTSTQPVADYWWARAVLIDARSTASC